jgi:hypothetical protein
MSALDLRDAVLSQVRKPARGPMPRLLIESLTATESESDCWPWAGALTSNGYGRTALPGILEGTTTAHRAVYVLAYGPVASDLAIDHLCHDPAMCHGGNACPHRACVNPTHLAAVTPRENVLRSNSFVATNAAKLACDQGHDYTPENTYTDPRGRRACRTCQRAHWRRYAAAERAS